MAREADLWSLFERIQPAVAGNATFSGHHVPGRQFDYVTKGSAGEPVLLIRCHSGGPQRVPVRLRHLDVEYQVLCKVRDETGKADVGDFVKIACTGDKPPLYPFFLSSGDAIVQTLPNAPSEKDIYRCVESFAELFSALARPSARSIKGLWAELFVIQLSGNCASMVRGWHVDPQERFDFSKGEKHLEVKASESPERVHEFSVSQLRTAARSSIIVASILLQKSTGGIGILGLAERIEQRLHRSAELVPKLWANIAECMGEDFDSHLDAKYDEQFAASSLRLISASDIPCVPVPLPVDVVDARLKVSLSNVLRTKSIDWKDVEGHFV